MSSYELLELFGVSITHNFETRTRTIEVEFPPEDGALAAALREGERPEWKQMLAQVANINAVFRAAKLPKADGEQYGERLFFPMERIRQFAEDHRVIAEGRVIMFPGEG